MNLVKQLAQYLNKSEFEVIRFLIDAPKKYRVYKIPKRSHGHRVIAQPSKELKKYQRAFLDIYTFPIHKSATAYRTGKSIKDNALAHSKNSYLLKTDLENFFNSITPEVFWNSMAQSNPKTTPQFTQHEKVLVERLIFWSPSKMKNEKLVLSVGAPTSPTISNFCLHEFDQLLGDVCQGRKISYTRYADDLTFSTNEKNALFTMVPFIQLLLEKFFSLNLKLNHSKTTFSSKAHNRHVTGITITNDGQISLGRERKRYIKHLIHRFKYNQLDSSDVNHLQGLLSFAQHIEPMFITRLCNKYTEELMQSIYEASHE